MIKIGIIGYGNLGKGVHTAIHKQTDMELFGIFTKRDPDTVNADEVKVYHMKDLANFKDDIDVLIHCGSSEFDLPTQTPQLVKDFNIVDSYDQHAVIKEHIDNVEKNATTKTAIVSVGWDPGLFSATKTIMDAILPDGETQGFFGPGISQGPSNAASNVKGVKMARNYAYPNTENLEAFRNFKETDASKNISKVCYVVLEDNADKAQVEKDILAITHYFTGTKIEFIDEETMIKEHSKWAQGGRIIRRGNTSNDTRHTIEMAINLDSNPEFTAANLVTYARACYKMSQRNERGAYTALDVRPSDLSSKSRDQLIKEML